MKKFIIILAAALLANSAFADATDLAEKHFQAIANGDLNTVMNQYNDKSSLNWVGGPLDGQYSGKDSVESVWQKFTKAQGKMSVKVNNISTSQNPKGATVTADVFFSGNKTVPVRYVLSYRDNLLVNEIWQINPSLKQ